MGFPDLTYAFKMKITPIGATNLVGNVKNGRSVEFNDRRSKILRKYGLKSERKRNEKLNGKKRKNRTVNHGPWLNTMMQMTIQMAKDRPLYGRPIFDQLRLSECLFRVWKWTF